MCVCLSLTDTSGFLYEESMNLAELGKQAVGMWEGAGLLWWGKLKLAKDRARGMGMWMLLLL